LVSLAGGQATPTWPEAGFRGGGDERLVPQLAEGDPITGGERVDDGERERNRTSGGR
jgi:hypothetical protein